MNSKPTIMEQLRMADEGHYAIPHFNYSDIWDMTAIVRAAEEERSPVILAGVQKVTDAIGMPMVGAMGRVMMETAKVPVYHHLDHSTNISLCRQAVDEKFPMVMIDGSRESLARNIEMTREVAQYAHAHGAYVEGEIGKIKGSNVEGSFDGGDFLVRVDEAVELVESSGVDILAVGIGTAHGFYQGKPELNFERLRQVNEAIDIPLVLHGGTGIPQEDVREAIRLGVNKVNVGTIIKYVYLSSVQKMLNENPKGPSIHTIDLMLPAVEAIKAEVKRWIRVCMSNGKA